MPLIHPAAKPYKQIDALSYLLSPTATVETLSSSMYPRIPFSFPLEAFLKNNKIGMRSRITKRIILSTQN